MHSILIVEGLCHKNIIFDAGCDDISSADVASLLREAIQIGHSPSK